MTEQEDPSRERLKNHFAQRVTHQARQILELWQRLQANEWSPTSLAELDDANLRLLRFAKRFEQPEHTELARWYTELARERTELAQWHEHAAEWGDDETIPPADKKEDK